MSASSPVALSLAFLIPLGFALIATSGWPVERARRGAVAFFAALGLAVIGYVVVGFALQFGGVGLIQDHPGFAGLIWEWSALGPTWGPGWGMAGLAGWGLTGPAATSAAYALALANLPWVITAALIPVDRPARPHPRLGVNRAGPADRRPDLPPGRQLDLGRRLAGQPGPQPRSGPRVCRRRGGRARAPARRGGRAGRHPGLSSAAAQNRPHLGRRRCRRPAGRCWRCWAPWRC